MQGSLIQKIIRLKKSSTSRLAKKRMKEFQSIRKKGINAIFKELCFCILTANFSAEGGIRIQKAIGDGFLTMGEKELAKALRSNGYRFPNTRALYIAKAREKMPELKKALSMEPKELRYWLIKNIYGLGYKEASHFLRNIGFNDFAIIDFHIVDLLVSEGLIRKPRSITPKKYLKIENKLKEIAKEVGLTLGELDLYLWYLSTGKILK
ncbi:MAG: N-glycosylase/DNA lyase [Candidatus Anstonellales archaeon]